ncbi:MAG: nucleotide exchange factor GrpE [Gammaproteobacteria bacterium]|nr:nucleotide exchange factor GrpE [Gammaproteobacteria bacterium]
MTAQPDRPEKDSAEPADNKEETGEPADVAPGVEELKALAEENWSKYVRARAEVDNVRKRAARDVENAHRFALEKFSSELLAVRDSLEMGLAAEDANVDALRAGSEATLKLLASTMERFGVEEVDPEGEPFDPNQHEAMTTQPCADVEPGTVLTVFQKGYALNGRLLRPARVVVAKEAAGDGPES